MSDQSNDKSIWTHLNGILASLAALLTAIAGIVSILYTIGFFSPKPPSIAEVATLPANSPTLIAMSSPTIPPPTDVPTMIPPSTTPTIVRTNATPTLIPSPSPSPSLSPTPTIVLPSATPTNPFTPTPTATIPPPTISIKPGIYGLTITVPNSVPRNSAVSFTVTFLNTTTNPVNYNWYIKIYRPDNLRNSFSETPKQKNEIPVGKTSLKIEWQGLRGPGGCEPFFARAIWNDSNNQPIEFRNTDDTIAQSEVFNICP